MVAISVELFADVADVTGTPKVLLAALSAGFRMTVLCSPLPGKGSKWAGQDGNERTVQSSDVVAEWSSPVVMSA